MLGDYFICWFKLYKNLFGVGLGFGIVGNVVGVIKVIEVSEVVGVIGVIVFVIVGIFVNFMVLGFV